MAKVIDFFSKKEIKKEEFNSSFSNIIPSPKVILPKLELKKEEITLSKFKKGKNSDQLLCIVRNEYYSWLKMEPEELPIQVINSDQIFAENDLEISPPPHPKNVA